MDLDKVMAMTDVELRINVQELLGEEMSWITTWDNKERGLNEESVPDYPNDIDAAWELLPVMVEKDGGGMGRRYRFAEFFENQIDSRYWIEGPTHSLQEVLFKMLTPRAITRAFLIAMDTE